MKHLRPVDLAREHGISTQAVRNYEQDGCIPAAERTASGYRAYTEAHAAALRAYLALVPAHGYAVSGQIMRGLNTGSVDAALTAIDRGHAQLLRDRETLDAVEEAIKDLAPSGGPGPAGSAAAAAAPQPPTAAKAFSIGELARRLGVTAATLRNWEQAGILAPRREPVSGRRTYGVHDVRDAELTLLLRRGGHRLDHIRTIVEQIRTAGGTQALHSALGEWRRALTARGLAMLSASVQVARYVELGRGDGGSQRAWRW
ncbi:MerR family DNA-binding transcriptional regulator [Streptomyces sp. BG9H]|uniref:MerR family DNA-binding transcriptional regulator n=1 Tax=Streptomyces anatolicus TaxID=2675858 RepID=A0ABS6YKY9_9ACTN|nr:TioE family transcriptional regulator [Streptomyces anatolicus]MBW5422076.1 MerR family DNA-binding transcriptional regulator [Streptomyces anatolicus]